MQHRCSSSDAPPSLTARRALSPLAGAVAVAAAVLLTGTASATVLLNDTWADGSRAETNLPNESATWAGVSGSDGGTLTVSNGSLNNLMGTSSRKIWTYFTSDASAPDGNQPHNSVTHLNVGDTLTASVSFNFPSGVTSNAGNAGRDFRFGLFFDPTDARVQDDVNSDGGGSTAPWTDATGYGVQIPLNSNAANTTTPFQIGKRTTSNSSLLGSSGAYTFAPTGGTPASETSGSTYTASLALSVVSPTQLDVTATLLQGSTVLSTYTVSDLGTSFGGTAVTSGLPGSQGIYQDFDQLFFRMSSSTETPELDFTNFKVELTQTPEPGSALAISAAAGLLMMRRRRGREDRRSA